MRFLFGDSTHVQLALDGLYDRDDRWLCPLFYDDGVDASHPGVEVLCNRGEMFWLGRPAVVRQPTSDHHRHETDQESQHYVHLRVTCKYQYHTIIFILQYLP